MSFKLDLFGNPIIDTEQLRDKYIEPPFSVLNTQSAHWQKRKQKWLNLGIKSELGRDVVAAPGKFGKNINSSGYDEYGRKPLNSTSIFDPVLCEIVYTWFATPPNRVLDPFAGGSVRGIVAESLGLKYVGIDLSERQINANMEQAIKILPKEQQPTWYVGDSNKVLDDLDMQFDLLFTCPPYVDLEKYSDDKDDLSNMEYTKFLDIYSSIIKKACCKLRGGSFACFVVGDVRDKNGDYYGFVPDTVKAFQSAGMKFYNEAILLNSLGTAMLRANNCMKSKKLVKVHQNVLVFRKPDKEWMDKI